MTLKYLTIAFLLTNFIFSIPSWYIIYKYISKKPILSICLVDLIYRDTIFYIISLSFIASAGTIHTLMYDDDSFSLTWEFAMMYCISISIMVNAISISLIFSAGLRLISLIQNSEASGKEKLTLAALTKPGCRSVISLAF